MMDEATDFWDGKIGDYQAKTWANLPNPLAEEAATTLPRGSRILELGCGNGRDSAFFAANGFEVVAADFSPVALRLTDERAQAAGVVVTTHKVDLRTPPLPFDTSEFDAVYAFLSMHYLPWDTTKELFREVARVTKPNGRLFVTVNSVHDPEFASGEELEPGYKKQAVGDLKRYFSTDEMLALLAKSFRVDVCEYKTGTLKNTDDEFVEAIATRIDERM
jgi:SAM-dependent methyltransferase